MLLPASCGVPGPGEMSTPADVERVEFARLHGIVAAHLDLGAELGQVLHEVVDEAVVVVDHQNLHAPASCDEPSGHVIGR